MFFLPSPIEKRILVIDWLTSLQDALPTSIACSLMLPDTDSPPSAVNEPASSSARQSLPPLLFQYYSRFYPSIFDPWELREAKLYPALSFLFLFLSFFAFFAFGNDLSSVASLDSFPHFGAVFLLQRRRSCATTVRSCIAPALINTHGLSTCMQDHTAGAGMCGGVSLPCFR